MGIICTAFWSVYYVRPWPRKQLFHFHTAEWLQAILTRKDVTILLSDNTELFCESSRDLRLQVMLYSSKYKHCHTVKLSFFTTTTGLIVWLAPVFGGAALEIASSEAYFKEAEEVEDVLKDIPELKEGILPDFLFLDRGYRDLRKKLAEGGATVLLLPTSLHHRPQFTDTEVLYNLVCFSLV